MGVDRLAGKPATAEGEARALLARLGVEDADRFTCGDLVELADLIAAGKQAAPTGETQHRYLHDVRFHNLVHYIVAAVEGNQATLGDFREAVVVADRLVARMSPRRMLPSDQEIGQDDPRRI